MILTSRCFIIFIIIFFSTMNIIQALMLGKPESQWILSKYKRITDGSCSIGNGRSIRCRILVAEFILEKNNSSFLRRKRWFQVIKQQNTSVTCHFSFLTILTWVMLFIPLYIYTGYFVCLGFFSLSFPLKCDFHKNLHWTPSLLQS